MYFLMVYSPPVWLPTGLVPVVSSTEVIKTTASNMVQSRKAVTVIILALQLRLWRQTSMQLNGIVVQQAKGFITTDHKNKTKQKPTQKSLLQHCWGIFQCLFNDNLYSIYISYDALGEGLDFQIQIPGFNLVIIVDCWICSIYLQAGVLEKCWIVLLLCWNICCQNSWPFL